MSKQTTSNEIIKPNPNQVMVEGYENSHGVEFYCVPIAPTSHPQVVRSKGSISKGVLTLNLFCSICTVE